MTRSRVLLIALVGSIALCACGRSEQGELQRGLTVDQEEMAPESPRELEETEAERHKQQLDEEEQREKQLVEESQKGI